MREKPVTIEVRKAGQHWAVLAEEQLIAQTVYEKGAQTLEAVLRGLLRYTSRKFFRLAVSDAMKGPKPTEPAKGQKPPKAAKGQDAPKAPKATKEAAPAKAKSKKPAAKKESVTDAALAPAPEPTTPTPALAEPTTPAA